ncbi:MAG: hypothetical protein P1R58_07910 [bacterium]|nr:hypothetical protein [bacterium]
MGNEQNECKAGMDKDHRTELGVLVEVDALNEEVKVLALNLAIYLAKKKDGSEQITRLEPEFMRLVNGTIKVVREISTILNAANNLEKMVYAPPSGRLGKDQIEVRLRAILEQCETIRMQLSQAVDSKT